MPRKTAGANYAVIGMLLVIFVIGLVIAARPVVISQQSEENRLSVTGTATMGADPDEVGIVLGVETQALAASDSQSANAAAVDAVRSALVRAGLSASNVTTESYSLEIVRKYNDSTQEYQNVGYKTVHLLKIKSSDLGKAGDYVDIAVGGGANRVDGVSFSLSDAKEQSVRTQVLSLAGRDARAHADADAQGIGVSVKRVVSASESFFNVMPYASRDFAAGVSAAPTQITPGQVQVSASISVTYEIG